MITFEEFEADLQNLVVQAVAGARESLAAERADAGDGSLHAAALDHVDAALPDIVPMLVASRLEAFLFAASADETVHLAVALDEEIQRRKRAFYTLALGPAAGES